MYASNLRERVELVRQFAHQHLKMLNRLLSHAQDDPKEALFGWKKKIYLSFALVFVFVCFRVPMGDASFKEGAA